MSRGEPSKASTSVMSRAESDWAIDRVVIHQGEIPTSLVFSYGKIDAFPFLLVEIESGGVCGLGEAITPFSDFAKSAAPGLIGANPGRLESLLPALSDVPSIAQREAMAMALYDLVGRRLETPVHVLLGGARRTSIPGMPTIFAGPADEMARTAAEFVEQGFQALKLKVTGDLALDRARVRAVRESAGAGVTLQADANNGYSYASAVEACNALEQEGVSLFEDPCEATLEQYAQLRRKVGVKIMLDEPARTLKASCRVVEHGAADVIGQHPSAQGSIIDNVTINAMGNAFGIPTGIGDTGYLGIGAAAYQSIAAVVDSDMPCGELGGHVTHGFPEGLVYNANSVMDGAIQLTDQPGLGVELDRRRLEKFIKSTTVVDL